MDAVDWMVMAGKTLSVPSFASSVSSASSGLRRTTLPSIYHWQRHQGWHHSKPPGGQFRYGWPSPLHNQMLIVSICNSLSMGGWGRAATAALVSRSFPLPPDDDERISWVVAVAKELCEGVVGWQEAKSRIRIHSVRRFSDTILWVGCTSRWWVFLSHNMSFLYKYVGICIPVETSTWKLLLSSSYPLYKLRKYGTWTCGYGYAV